MKKKILLVAIIFTISLSAILILRNQISDNKINKEGEMGSEEVMELDVFKCKDTQFGKTVSTLNGQLIDLRFSLRDKYSEFDNVGEYLQSQGVKCQSDILVRNKAPILIYRKINCLVDKISNYDELVYEENKYIRELRTNPNFFEIPCYKN